MMAIVAIARALFISTPLCFAAFVARQYAAQRHSPGKPARPARRSRTWRRDMQEPRHGEPRVGMARMM
jgi:hypothetical protein